MSFYHQTPELLSRIANTIRHPFVISCLFFIFVTLVYIVLLVVAPEPVAEGAWVLMLSRYEAVVARLSRKPDPKQLEDKQ